MWWWSTRTTEAARGLNRMAFAQDRRTLICVLTSALTSTMMFRLAPGNLIHLIFIVPIHLPPPLSMYCVYVDVHNVSHYKWTPICVMLLLFLFCCLLFWLLFLFTLFCPLRAVDRITTSWYFCTNPPTIAVRSYNNKTTIEFIKKICQMMGIARFKYVCMCALEIWWVHYFLR